MQKRNNLLVLAATIGMICAASLSHAQDASTKTTYKDGQAVISTTVTCCPPGSQAKAPAVVKGTGKKADVKTTAAPKKEKEKDCGCKIETKDDRIYAGQTGRVYVKVSSGCKHVSFSGGLFGDVADHYLVTGTLYRTQRFWVSAQDAKSNNTVTQDITVWVQGERYQSPPEFQQPVITIVDNGCKVWIESSPTTIVKGQTMTIHVRDSGDCSNLQLTQGMDEMAKYVQGENSGDGVTKKIKRPVLFVAQAKSALGHTMQARLFVVPLNNPAVMQNFVSSNEPIGGYYQTQPVNLLYDYYRNKTAADRSWEHRNWWWQALIVGGLVEAGNLKWHYLCHINFNFGGGGGNSGNNNNNNNNNNGNNGNPHNSQTSNPANPGGP